jgi:hypothetical protein
MDEQNINNQQSMEELIPGGDELELDEHLKEVERRDMNLKKDMVAEDKKIRDFKISLLRDFYDGLKRMGVDPGDVNSISNFLADLEQKDPDMVIVIENILNALNPENGLLPTDNQGDMSSPLQAPGMPETGGEPSIMNAPPVPPDATTTPVQ